MAATTVYTPTVNGASIRVEVPRTGATVHIAVNGDVAQGNTLHQPPSTVPAVASEAAGAALKAEKTESWHNWAGNYQFTPGAWHQPRSEEQLQDIVRAASCASPPRIVRVVGVGHSFNPMNAPCDCDCDCESAREGGPRTLCA